MVRLTNKKIRWIIRRKAEGKKRIGWSKYDKAKSRVANEKVNFVDVYRIR